VEKYEIRIDDLRCTGCSRCQLACSDLYFRSFNPSLARIRILMSGADYAIELTDECTHCGICVDHCFYGALQKDRREAHP
jgi:Fe-S-cluster-containing dehydrogenase component